METALFDYHLPQDFIAQTPAEPRDHARLLVLHRRDGRIEHRVFHEIGGYLRPSDLLIANDSRVLAARLHGRKSTGGQVEVFLLHSLDADEQEWECLVRGRGLTPGASVRITSKSGEDSPLSAQIIAELPAGTRQIRFDRPLRPWLETVGSVPLPPYITGYTGDAERYQTVYSRDEGSVAAPTAGLHFTPELLLALRQEGIAFDTVTLHVGLDTFQPVSAAHIEDHVIHTEHAMLGRDTARRINDATLAGGRIVAVGTTSVRTLEWAATGAQGLDPYDTQACPWQRTAAFSGAVPLYIRPGYRFRAVDALITNFHLPRSSLLMLVSAFIGQAHPDDIDAGRRILLATYEQAKQSGYRFYSFGDAMLIV